MARIEMSVGLDSSNLQQGAKGAADSLGDLYDRMAKLQTAGERKNAIYEYMQNADAGTREFAKTMAEVIEKMERINSQSGNPQLSQIYNQGFNANDSLVKKLRDANISRLKNDLTDCDRKILEIYEHTAGLNTESKEFAENMRAISQLEYHKKALSGELRAAENEGKTDSRVLTSFMSGNFAGALGAFGIGGIIATAISSGISKLAGGISSKMQSDIAAESQYLSGDVIGGSITEKENGWYTKIPLIGDIIKSGIQIFSTNEDRRIETELNAWLKESAPSIESLALYTDLYDLSNGFGVYNHKGATANSRRLQDSYSRMAELVSQSGTGYSTNEGIEVKNQLAEYGYSEKDAESAAISILKWQRATGADRSGLMDFAGYATRYGGASNVTEALAFANAGLQASGMHTGQLPEFLRSMKSIMEEGIAKGFVYGAEEISSNMAFLSKLTGNNAMWSGENAAKKISGINSSLESSTSLDSVAAVMNFQVAQSLVGKTQEDFDAYMNTFFKVGNKDVSLYTGTYLDTLMAMEKGLTPETVGKTMEAIEKMYNIGFGSDGSLSGRVEEAATMLTQMWGLNTTGAVQMMKSWAVNGTVTDDQITAFTTDPNMQTKETQLQATINDIKNDTMQIAQTVVMDTTAERILDEIRKNNSAKQETEAKERISQSFDKIMGDIYSDKDRYYYGQTLDADAGAFAAVKEKFLNATGDDAIKSAEIMDLINKLSAEERKQLDTSGVANSFKDLSMDEILNIIRNKEFGIGRTKILSPFVGLSDDFEYNTPEKSPTRKNLFGFASSYSFEDFLEENATPLLNFYSSERGITKDKAIDEFDAAAGSFFKAANYDNKIDKTELTTIMQLLLTEVKRMTQNELAIKDAFEQMSININVQQ